MIGNDVIDLEKAARDSNWQRRGFLEKLFTDREQQLILSSKNPEISVWNLWSRKESAYKIFNRQTGVRAFNPVFFECCDLSMESSVRFAESSVFTRTDVCDDRISTIAVSHPDQWPMLSDCKRREIQKIENLPFFNQFPASISHHGRFTECYFLNLKSDGFDVDRICEGAMHGAFLGYFQ